MDNVWQIAAGESGEIGAKQDELIAITAIWKTFVLKWNKYYQHKDLKFTFTYLYILLFEF